MKKIFCTLVVLLMMVCPVIAKAANKVSSSDFNTMNLTEALNQEGIEVKYKSFENSSEKATIYLFRGNGCGYCRSFLSFLNSIVDEYGKYFNVVSFESWYDDNNAQLLQDLSTFMNEPAQGVPYIIIGDQIFGGYSNEYDEDIKKAIVNLYNSKNRYDVFEAYSKNSKSKDSEVSSDNVIIWNIIITTLGVLAICFYVNRSNDKLLKEIKSINKNLTSDNTIVESEINDVKKSKKK